MMPILRSHCPLILQSAACLAKRPTCSGAGFGIFDGMKNMFFGILAIGLASAWAQASPDASVLEAESQREAVMRQAKDCVLAIFPPNGQGGGSGVVISADGFALSNFHVVSPCGKAMQCGMADGRVYDAVVVSVDPTGDVALIKLFGRNDFPHATLGDSDHIRVGDWAFAMGNPFLLATDFQPTVTFGLVSGVHRYQFPAGTLLEYTDCLQVDTSINPGNSGGPLFDLQGRLIGINGRASFEKRGTGERWRGLCHLDQPNQAFFGRAAQRANRRPCHHGRASYRGFGRPGRCLRHSRNVRRLPSRTPLRRRDCQLCRPADYHPKRLQKRVGHLSARLARSVKLPPRRQTP